MQKPHVPGSLISAFNAKKQKAAVPEKGEMGMVMKKKRKASKFFGGGNIKKKGTAHTASRTGLDAAGDLHEEKASKRRKGAKKCKTCHKTACKHTKRKTAKKA